MSSQVYWVSLATVISVHAPSNPTTTKTDMPAPTIRTILLRVCRWGSRITWRASVEIVSSTVTCVCTITWHSPTMVKPASSVHSGKSVTCKKLMVGLKEQKQHLSGYVNCPFGRVYNYVDATKHQCYIQVAKSPKQEKEEKCQNGKSTSVQPDEELLLFWLPSEPTNRLMPLMPLMHSVRMITKKNHPSTSFSTLRPSTRAVTIPIYWSLKPSMIILFALKVK